MDKDDIGMRELSQAGKLKWAATKKLFVLS